MLNNNNETIERWYCLFALHFLYLLFFLFFFFSFQWKWIREKRWMIRRNDSFVPQFQLLTPHFLFLYIFFRQRRFIRNAKSDIDYDANVTEFTNLSKPILTASTIPTKTEIKSDNINRTFRSSPSRSCYVPTCRKNASRESLIIVR